MIPGDKLQTIYFDLLEMGIGNYPFNLPFLQSTKSLELHPNVTFFVGENGMGKSTLIEAIAIALGFNAEGGTKNFNFNTRQSHSPLYKYLRTSKGVKQHTDGFFLRSESFFNVATEIEKLDEEIRGPRIIDSYGGKSLHEQSHGEAFWSLFINRFVENGFYILDEPESALSPTRQQAMLYHMHELIKSGSQFIIATHSPILIAYPHARIYEFSHQGLEIKTYKETELFRSYNDFINNSDRHIHYLLR